MTPARDQLASLLDSRPDVAVVTFDFFDTLVTRSVAQPTHVFAVMEDELTASDARWSGFARDRVEAEQAARRRAHANDPVRDVTLEEIYREFALMRTLSTSEVSDLMRRERGTEIALAQPVAHGKQWWNEVGRRGIRRLVISDNYMSSEHLAAMAQAVGYTDLESSDIWVSSEHGGQKHNGALWRTVLETLEVDPRMVVHLGDDPHADDAVPRGLGITSLVYPAMRVSHRDMHNTAPAVLPLSRIEAHLRNEHAESWDAAAALGHGAIALVVASQVKEAHALSQQLGATKVHFAARDGYLAHQVWHRLRASDSTMRDASYLSFSRSVIWRATLTQVTDDNAHRFVGDDEILTVSRLERRVGSLLTSASLSPEMRLDAERARAVLVENSDVIVAASRALRARLATHLRRCGLLDAGAHVVVDLGWTASTVADLAELVTELTDGASQVHGLFTGLYWDATAQRTRMPMHGVAMDEIAPLDDNLRLLGVVKFMEALVTAPHGSVVDFTDAGEPVAADTPVERRAYESVMGAVGAAAVDSAELILRGTHPAGVSAADVTPAATWAAMMQAGHTPRRDEVELLASIHHVTDIDHEGDGRPMIAAQPARPKKHDSGALEEIHDALIRRHWMQGTLNAWRHHGAVQLVDAIEHGWPHTRSAWVHSLRVR